MSLNHFGHLLRLSTWGESHGPAIGGMLDGCPPGVALDEAHVQTFLDRRRPGTGRNVTPRQEPDRVRLLSGLYEGRTTGTPIAFMIDNVDARSKDYPADAPYRPGHADYSYDAKYGFRDPRGGGRASARETAIRVAAGAIARLVIPDVRIAARVTAIGGEDDSAKWESMLDQARTDGDSLGALVEVVAAGVPMGWGAPVYAKLDAALAGAMMSIPAVKGVEIGAGMAAAAARGSQNADPMRAGAEGPAFTANHSGGVAGGISTGQDVIVRMAYKPTSSIRTPVPSVNAAGEEVEASTRGRHDPCVGIRGAPVAEAMMALVLADHFLLHRAQCGGG
ncbi:chorismate synthase [Sphingomicrobium astaxanthinifaciens]|uniref:chorismate synthase n=1 Tax=Sphingomicrobium astaxanthinifaciens TaxID=1227949 RepID=UPI001FCCB802|nr:chorismate synthase [Sphingomicrobium astaxanthinifaciens]MCJ7421034.1 chorismate synthase [Sphingomicrobium astaxanthinifaciens]